MRLLLKPREEINDSVNRMRLLLRAGNVRSVIAGLRAIVAKLRVVAASDSHVLCILRKQDLGFLEFFHTRHIFCAING